jgi:hypothetical protein
VAGVETRLFVDGTGRAVGIDLWTAADADPCEVRFSGVANGLPTTIDVRRGTAAFATFRVVADAAAATGEGPR